MWHIDEGALHAYLDGALDEYPAAEARRVREHLDECAACAERLAVERGVRERAGEILELAVPRVDTPTFEELRAYVRRSQPVSSVSVRLYRIGWAASVALALGTGWLLRGQPMPPLAPTGSVPVPVEQEFAAEASGEAVGTEPIAAVVPEAASTPPSAQRAEERVERAAAAERVEGPRDAAGAGAALLDAATVAADRSRSAPASAALPSRDDVAADLFAGNSAPAPASAPPPAVADASGRQVGAATAEVEALKVTPAQPTSSAPTAGSDAARRSAPDQRITSALAEPGVQGPMSRAAPQTSSVPTELVDDDAVSLVVPGLEVLDVLPVGEGTTFAGMRALQRLQSGDTLELVHLPETVSPASLPPLRVGWTQLVHQRGAGWLVMRAPLAEEALVELLQRLEEGR